MLCFQTMTEQESRAFPEGRVPLVVCCMIAIQYVDVPARLFAERLDAGITDALSSWRACH